MIGGHKAEPPRIETAVMKYLDDDRARHLAEATITKLATHLAASKAAVSLRIHSAMGQFRRKLRYDWRDLFIPPVRPVARSARGTVKEREAQIGRDDFR